MKNIEHLNEWHKLGWIADAIKEARKGNLAELDQALELIEFLQGQKRFSVPHKIIYLGE